MHFFSVKGSPIFFPKGGKSFAGFLLDDEIEFKYGRLEFTLSEASCPGELDQLRPPACDFAVSLSPPY
jgi:hypothetical protein